MLSGCGSGVPEYRTLTSPEEIPGREDMFAYPQIRHSICNMRMFFPTENVQAAQVDRHHLYESFKPKLAEVSFIPSVPVDGDVLVKTGTPGSITVREALQKTSTDGFIVMYRGRIVYEYYDGYLTPQGVHALMSLSKSLTSTLAAVLIANNTIDQNALASRYVPELRNSAFGTATVREIMDMQTSLAFNEVYDDPESDIWQYASSSSFRDYLVNIQQQEGVSHGDRFVYRTPNTDALAWIITRATGKSLGQLMSELIWQPIGAHYDAYCQVDGKGTAFAGGGFSANLRDLAAFGEALRRNGYFNGGQAMPFGTTDILLRHAQKDKFDKLGYPNLKGWSYSGMWWVTGNSHRAYMARGVYGQAIYIDPAAEMVIVRLASFPVASNSANDLYSLPMYAALGEYMMRFR